MDIFGSRSHLYTRKRLTVNTLRRVAFGDPATEPVPLSLNRLIAYNTDKIVGNGPESTPHERSSNTDMLLLS